MYLNEREALEAKIEFLEDALRCLSNLTDVGLLFDGCDHLNEFTHEANEKHMEGALDRANQIIESALKYEEWDVNGR